MILIGIIGLKINVLIFKKEKKNQEQRELCYYFDTILDIHHENFWDQWVSCNCISKQINSFKEEL